MIIRIFQKFKQMEHLLFTKIFVIKKKQFLKFFDQSDVKEKVKKAFAARG